GPVAAELLLLLPFLQCRSQCSVQAAKLGALYLPSWLLQGTSMKQHRLAAAVALVGLVLAGCDAQTSEVDLKTPAQKASYGIGLNMGKSLAQEGLDDLDPKAVALGIEDAIGKKEQRLKDDELVEAFAFLQKRAEDRMAKL